MLTNSYIAGILVPPFNPLSRFVGGKQGTVVDLNNFATLWQDTARTTPVTAAGQTVKGITDLSGRGNHLANAVGYVLGNDGTNNYLQADGSANYFGSSGTFAWGSDKVSIFMGLKKDSGTGGNLVSFGQAGVNAGSFEFVFFLDGLLMYRQGSGSFGGQGTRSIGSNITVASSVADLSGTTQLTENPYLRALGVDGSRTSYGAADSGTGNFGTWQLRIGALYTGRIYSFFIVADTSTAAQVSQGESWAASKCGKTMANIAAPTPIFLDTGTTTDMGTYTRTSSFAHADYTTTATDLFVSYVSTYGATPPVTELGIYSNGVYQTTLLAGANGAFNQYVSLPAGAKTVRFVNGSQSSPDQSLNPVGTFLTGVTANAEMVALNTAATNRIVEYGDSIGGGSNATSPIQQAWPMIVRNAYGADSMAVEAWGFRALQHDCPDSTARAVFVAKIAAYFVSTTGTQRIWLAIGTNDYGLNRWSAANFGTAYAALLDALHVALPSATIFAQTPLVRTSEVANIYGDTLGAYRTQIATAQSTRSAYCTLVDGSTILASPGDLDVDGVHPTTAGQAKYALSARGTLSI